MLTSRTGLPTFRKQGFFTHSSRRRGKHLGKRAANPQARYLGLFQASLLRQRSQGEETGLSHSESSYMTKEKCVLLLPLLFIFWRSSTTTSPKLAQLTVLCSTRQGQSILSGQARFFPSWNFNLYSCSRTKEERCSSVHGK